MNRIFTSLALMLGVMTAWADVNVTAEYKNGKVSLTWTDAEYADGVDWGTGGIKLQDEVGTVKADLVQYDYDMDDFSTLIYTLSDEVEDGYYKVVIPEGAVVTYGGNAPIPAAEARLSISKSTGDVDFNTLFGAATPNPENGSTVTNLNWIKFNFGNNSVWEYEGYQLVAVPGVLATLADENGIIETSPLAYNENTWTYGFSFTSTLNGYYYTVTVAEGSYQILDSKDNVVASSPEVVLSYFVGENGGIEEQPVAQTWVFPSVTPAEGVVTEIAKISFPYAEGTEGVNENPFLDVVDANGNATKFMFSDNFSDAVEGVKVGGGSITEPGTYTLTIPANTFTSFSDNSANAEMSFSWTIASAATSSEIELNITKKDWATIGNENGEVIGTVNSSIDPFDHYEAEIRCKEDADQYISFANIYKIKGDITCYSFEGGHYDLNEGYHYTLTVKAFDVPYYGAKPVATTTYEFVGTGVKAASFADVTATIDLAKNAQGLGYDLSENGIIGVQFSAPVKNASAWVAMGFDGSRKLSITPADSEGKKWTIDASSFIGDEGSFDLHVTAYDIASGLQIRGLDADHSFYFSVVTAISVPVSTKIIVGGEEIGLSEEIAASMAMYPENAVLQYENSDPAVVRVTYDITDTTKGEVIKSMADLTNNGDGTWTAVAPKDYVFIKNHTYELNIVARSSQSAMSDANILYTQTYYIVGTTEGAPELSEIVFISVNPDTDEVLTGATDVELTFSAIPASVEAWASHGIGSRVNLDATIEANVIRIKLTEEVMDGGLVSLFVRAKDAEGNIIGDGDNTVNPENGYLQFEWSTTVGLPTPELVEDGQTITELATLSFTYAAGIGLNYNTGYNWMNIEVINAEGIIVATNFTENQFAGSGEGSESYTTITLTLDEPITAAGKYTVVLPYGSFFLGQEYDAYLNAAAEYTVTVGSATAIETIGNDKAGNAAYNLAGQRVNANQKGIIIRDGKKVVVK